MKKIVLTAVLVATVALSAGCSTEPIPGKDNAPTQGVVEQVDAVAKSKERIQAKAYAARVVAEHESMMAGQEWTVTGGGWESGAAVTVTLTSSDGVSVGGPADAAADPQGNISVMMTIPEGTTTGQYKLVATSPADTTGPHTATVNVFSN